MSIAIRTFMRLVFYRDLNAHLPPFHHDYIGIVYMKPMRTRRQITQRR